MNLVIGSMSELKRIFADSGYDMSGYTSVSYVNNCVIMVNTDNVEYRYFVEDGKLRLFKEVSIDDSNHFHLNRFKEVLRELKLNQTLE